MWPNENNMADKQGVQGKGITTSSRAVIEASDICDLYES